MAQATIQQARVFQNSGAVLMARIVKDNGAAIVQADISTITCNVYNATTGVLIASPTVSVAGNIFNSLQTNAAWTIDSTGFNCSAALSGINWPTGGVNEQVELTLTPTSGYPFKVVWDFQVLTTYSG